MECLEPTSFRRKVAALLGVALFAVALVAGTAAQAVDPWNPPIFGDSLISDSDTDGGRDDASVADGEPPTNYEAGTAEAPEPGTLKANANTPTDGNDRDGQTPQSTEKRAETDDEGSSDDEKSLEERFADLEKQLQDLTSTVGDVESVAGNPSLVVSGSSNSTMKVFGRVHADGWGFDIDPGDTDTITRFNDNLEPQNRLGFRRLRIGVGGKVRDNMLYKIETEFANGNNVEFRDAYLGWSDLAVLQTVLLGNQKRPYGLDHLNSSNSNVFIERPFVIEAFNQDARRLGLQSINVSDSERFNWRYGVFNQRNIQGFGNYIDDHLQLQIAGRLANTFWYDEISGGRGYGHWAISGTHADSAPNADGILVGGNGNETQFRTRPEARSTNRWINTGRIAAADYYDLIGFEGVINVGAFQVVGEYQRAEVSRNSGFADTTFDGGYLYASYFLTGEHLPWDRETGTLGRVTPFQNFWFVNKSNGTREAGWGAWQIAARYSRADFSDQDVLGGEGESFTLATNWHWNSNARMQFNYINGDIFNRDVGLGPEAGGYQIYGARFMIDF